MNERARNMKPVAGGAASKPLKPSPSKDLFRVSKEAKARTESFLTGPVSEQALSALFDDLHRMADEVVATLAASVPQRKTPACKSGCSACCYLRVPVTSLEVLFLATKVQAAFSKEALAELMERANQIAREADGLSVAERALRRIPCPFLKEDRCSVYEWRPLDCRGYGSFDAGACNRLLDDFRTWPPPIPMVRYAVFKNVQAGLVAALEETGFSIDILDLALAARIAFREDDLLDGWRQAGSIFETAAIDAWDMDSLTLLPGTPPV